MAEKETREGMYEAFSKLGESFFSVDGAKKAAAWYIATTERVATQALELQEKATGWAKETPLATLFDERLRIAEAAPTSTNPANCLVGGKFCKGSGPEFLA